MKRITCLTVIFLAACALHGQPPPGGNLLKNADFSAGMEGWRANGGKHYVKDGAFVVELPPSKARPSWDVQLHQPVALTGGRKHLLSFTLDAEAPGTFRAVYLTEGGNPPERLGLETDIPVKAGRHSYCLVFTTDQNNTGLPARLTFSVGQLNGKNALSAVRLEEAGAELPLALGESWKVFLKEAEPTSCANAPDGKLVAKLKNNAIDLRALAGTFKPRDTAILYNEFVAAKPGVTRLGAAADYWMEVYVNGAQVYSTMARGNGGNGQYTPDDHVVDMPVKAGKNVLAVVVQAGSGGWRFACGTPRPALKFEAGSEWKTVDMADVQVKAGSALDLEAASAIPRESGPLTWLGLSNADKALPRLAIGPSGKLVAAGHPVRLRGFTSPSWLLDKATTKEDRAKYAKLSRLQGYNLFRFGVDELSPDKDMDIQPELLDRVDQLLSQMSGQGIYAHVILGGCGLYRKNPCGQFQRRNDLKVAMYLGDPDLRQAWKYGVETLMNHVNPYTGLAWKDDPAIACVDFYNEQEAGFLWGAGSLEPETLERMSARFRLWLKAKYQAPEALAKAWGDATITSFEQVAAPKNLLNNTKNSDLVLFCNELSRDCFDWYDATLRATGYKGLASQYDVPAWFGDSEARYEKSQVAVDHKYFNHPSNFSTPGSTVRQNSAVGDAAGYWRAGNASRFADRPFFITEFNHTFWNKYLHEGGLLFGAYSGLQGFDALVVHEGAVLFETKQPMTCFSVGNSPVGRANEFLAACLFLRGDVKPSPHRVQLDIPRSRLGEFKTVSSEQDKIGLMSGFTVAFPWAERPKGVATPEAPDMSLTASDGAETGGDSGWAVETLAMRDAKFSLDAFVASMKAKGVLPDANLSAPAKGVFQSDTGEITMRTQENLLKVATPRTEAVTLEGGKGEAVGKLNVVNVSVPACVAVCALDGEELAESGRLVLVYSTETANSGMELSPPDGVTLRKLGKLPALMRVGTLDAVLENDNAAAMSLYALGFDGSRREQLPLEFVNGKLKLHLDTAKLKDGPTPFFELAVE